MSKTGVRVCVVLPAYNEATVIFDVIKNAKQIFTKSGYDIEIVVVNDGSRDETSSEAKKAGAKVIDHILNSGAGGATLTGITYAKNHQFDLAATMDADGQHDPNDVLKGIKLIQESDTDLLIGSRLKNSDGMSKVKVIGNYGLSLLTLLFFGVNSSDSQSGLRIYSKKAIDTIKWKTRGYEFCSEMLWRAKQQGLEIDEYPIKAIYTDYSKGKGQNNWNGINILKSMISRRIMELLG